MEVQILEDTHHYDGNTHYEEPNHKHWLPS